MKRVIVTGGMGFIGFHLCQRLVENGIEVMAVDERPKERQAEHEEKEMRIGRNALFRLYSEKVENVNLTELLKKADTVFHLAASTQIESHQGTHLSSMIENNVQLTKRLLQACRKGVRFIYPSTVQVYGERTGVISERTSVNPTTPYGITKLASELIVQKEQRG